MSFRLQYPIGEESGQITLRSPDLGNTEQVGRGQYIGRLRSGEIVSVHDTDWPQVRKRVFSFSVITEAVIDDLRTFLSTTAGLKIRIIDHLDNAYDGYITTPTNEIITVKDTCSYSINFEFEDDAS